MTYKELICQIVQGCDNLDKQVNIRILHRDIWPNGEVGSVTQYQIVKVARYNITHDQFSVELSDIMLSKVEANL